VVSFFQNIHSISAVIFFLFPARLTIITFNYTQIAGIMKVIRVKICCIASVEEARLAISCGASAVGLVSEMPSGPGVITEEEIAHLAATIPPGVASFLLTSRQTASEVIRQQQYTGVNTIQLVDAFPLDGYRELRAALPGIKIVQVIHVRDEDSLSQAKAIAPHVDGLLLDSGNPSIPVKELGGTGRTHNWSISSSICKSVNIPVYLAGGLHAGNVAEAVSAVQPFGVDLCSGVRTNGKLDEVKLKDFFQQINTTHW
jgi:phosphoribosylanthranilate isomerase